jgi:hypothetical protein
MLFNFAISVLSFFFILKSLQRIARHYNIPELNTELMIAVFVIWMFMNPSQYCWNIITLMDSGIYVFLLSFSFSFFIRLILENSPQKKKMSLIMVLMVLGRPEGIFWGAGFLVLYFLIINRSVHSLKDALKITLTPLAFFLGTVILLTLYRLIYFGYPLPNTYYTKVSASITATLKDGFEYLTAFLNMYHCIILVPALLLLVLLIRSVFRRKLQTSDHLSITVLLFVFLGISLPVVEGGDHFHGFRFFQPVYPFLILPLFLVLIGLKQAYSFLRIALILIPSIIILFFLNKADWNNFKRNNNTFQGAEDLSLCIKIEFNIAEITRNNGKRLNDFFEGALPIIGYGAAGGIAIGYDGVVLDMLGLNLPKLAHADKIKVGPKAHQSFNKRVFFELSPEILMPTAEPAGAAISLDDVNSYYCNIGSWDNLIYKDLFNDTEFRKKYTLALASNSAKPEYICYGFFRNDYLEKLSKQPNYKFQLFSYNGK